MELFISMANKTQTLHTLTSRRFITPLGSFRINLNARAGELTRSLTRPLQTCLTIAGKSHIGSVVVLVWTHASALRSMHRYEG